MSKDFLSYPVTPGKPAKSSEDRVLWSSDGYQDEPNEELTPEEQAQVYNEMLHMERSLTETCFRLVKEEDQ
jgi:hypothetical protein